MMGQVLQVVARHELSRPANAYLSYLDAVHSSDSCDEIFLPRKPGGNVSSFTGHSSNE